MIFILKLQRQSPSSRNPSALLFPGCQPHTCTGLQLRVCSLSSLRTRLWCTMILLLTSQGCPGATSSFIASPLTSSTNVLLRSSHFASHFFCLSDCFVFVVCLVPGKWHFSTRASPPHYCRVSRRRFRRSAPCCERTEACRN
jgi:hypothetical protein